MSAAGRQRIIAALNKRWAAVRAAKAEAATPKTGKKAAARVAAEAKRRSTKQAPVRARVRLRSTRGFRQATLP